MRFKEFLTEASVRDQIIADVRKHGGSVNDYYVRLTDIDKLGYSARQSFGRSPDVDHPKFSVNYIGTNVGSPALWFYPLKYFLDNQDMYGAKRPYVWLVKLKPTAWLQPVKSDVEVKQPAPQGQDRVGILRSGNPPAAIFFKPAFDVVGKYYDYAGQHKRHGEVKGKPAPTFMDRLRGVNEGTDFTNAVNSIEKLIKQNNIEFKSYEELLKFVASRKFLQPQRNDQQFINDVTRSVLRRLHQHQVMTEVRSDDDADWDDDDDEYAELKVSKRIRKYFTDRGYGYLGEGRDQMAFLSPRGTVLKILGIGEDEREDIVKSYVGFFLRNQRNPHYPRIYNAGDFAVDGESYFVYEMEYLHPVSGEDRVLEYIEDLMSAIPYGEKALYAFHKNKARPPELSAEQVDGLVAATQDLEDALGGQAPLDLRAIENLGRRDNGQIVIIDPFSL